jgi:Fe-S oxidoreductase
MTHWLARFRREIEYCSYCPKLCRFACPVAEAEHSETLTPTGKQTILKLVRDGLIPLDRAAAEIMYLCTGCLISRTYCEHAIEVYPPFEAARIEAVKRAVAPEPALRFSATWQKRGNPFAEDLGSILAGHMPAERLGGRATTVLFYGCATLHYFPEQIADTARVLAALAVDFRAFNGERLCCGQPLLALGHETTFIEQARKVAAGLEGAELVLTPCPACAHFLRHRYPEYGIEIKARVRHLTEFVAERIDQLPLTRREPRPTVYHDPCLLGRCLGVYDEPRRILRAALSRPLLEFAENRERSVCCGGGGGLPVVRPDTARAIARERSGEAPELGAELIATACPMCRRMLGRAGRDAGVAADDVISILARALG